MADNDLQVSLDQTKFFAVKLIECMTQRDELLSALTNLVCVIEKAGLINLSNGVQLGQMSWLMKATDAVEYSKLAIAKCEKPAS
jgi:hypothetical protein